MTDHSGHNDPPRDAFSPDSPSSIDFGIELVSKETWEVASGMRFVEQRVLISLAVGCGWKYDISKGIHLQAVDGTKIDLPIQSNINARMFRSRVNTIVRHRSFEGTKGGLLSLVEGLIAHPKVKLDPDRVHVLREAVGLADEAPATAPVEPVKPSKRTVVKPVPKVTHRKLRIVREEPWNAHRNAKGETYPSEAVMERTWSNDTVDYRCRWEEDLSDRSNGCDWTSDSPHSVASHNAGHKRGMGTQPQPAVDGLDPEWAVNPRRATRIRNLAREIDGALQAAIAEGIVADPEWLAQWIIDHRIDALPSAGGSEEGEALLTTEQILDKIAALCDRGRGKVLREQVDTLQGQVEAFMSEVTEAKALAEAQSLRASRAEGNLKTLGEILADLQTQRDAEESTD
jgi:hypothetical protein